MITEIDKLAEMLEKAGVKFIRNKQEQRPWRDKEIYGEFWQNQVLVKYDNFPVISAICHYGSYGHELGLIECYDFSEEPRGYLDAEQAFEYFKKVLNIGEE